MKSKTCSDSRKHLVLPFSCVTSPVSGQPDALEFARLSQEPSRAAAGSILLIVALLLSSGCTGGKILATPLTFARDTVDAPVVTVTNVFAAIARSSGGPAAFAGPSWSLRGGFDFGIGLNLASWIFWTLSGAVGAVDYVACRSIYPNFPKGISPWLKRGESWWGLYYPNTRALWSTKKEQAPPPQPAPPRPTSPPDEIRGAANPT